MPTDTPKPPIAEPDAASPEGDALLDVGAQITGGTLQMLAAQAMNVPLGILTNALLTRMLGPGLFGLLVVVGGITAWFEVFVVRTLGRTSIRLIATAEDWQDTASQFLQIQFLIGVAGGLGLFAAAPWIAAALATPALTPYLQIAAVELPIAAVMRLQESALIGRRRFGGRAIIMGVHGVIRLALVFGLLSAGLSLTGALLASIGAAFGQFLVARWLLPVPIRAHRSLPWGAMRAYAVPLFLYTIAITFYQNLDILLVKLLNPDPEAAGYYGAAETLMSMAGMVSVAVSPLLLSVISGLWHQGSRESAQAVIRQAIRLPLILLPFIALAGGSSGEIIRFLYGDAFAPAAPMMAWLVFAGLAAMLHSTITACLTAIDAPKLTVWVTAPMLPLLVIAVLVANPLLGPLGVAISTTLILALGCVGAIAMLAWKSGARLPWVSMARMSLLAAGAFWLGTLGDGLWPADGALLIARLGVQCVVIGGLLFATFEVTSGEVRFVAAMLGRSIPELARFLKARP